MNKSNFFYSITVLVLMLTAVSYYLFQKAILRQVRDTAENFSEAVVRGNTKEVLQHCSNSVSEKEVTDLISHTNAGKFFIEHDAVLSRKTDRYITKGPYEYSIMIEFFSKDHNQRKPAVVVIDRIDSTWKVVDMFYHWP